MHLYVYSLCAESSGEAIRGNIVDTTTTNSASGAQPSTVLDNIARFVENI